uniref:BPL/LPL catalytic domain-containing protein n=1 Tax=Panagrellus redivivus TaxID=6233 RepID=A0A7E4WC57_PANRE
MLLRGLRPLGAAVASTCSRTPLTCELAHAKPIVCSFRRGYCDQGSLADSESGSQAGSDRMYDFFVDALIRAPVVGGLVDDEARSRRRSLSPGTLSIINGLDAKTSGTGAISLVNTAALGAHSRLQADHGQRRRSCTPTRRRLFSIPGKGKEGDAKPAMKPPTILVYTANNPDLFQRIFASLRQILPKDTYTITHLTQKSLIADHWQSENAVCVLLADTKTLGDLAWSKLQGYFIHSGKIIFLCQNSLLANLTNCSSTKKQASLLRSAFGNKQASLSLGKDFEQFLKKSMKTLGKTKEVSDTFHAKDVVGGYKYSVVIHKKKDQPLLLYMENRENNASALFSDATSDQLVTGGGSVLIADALQRLGIDIAVDAEEIQLTQGYMMCEPDRLTWSMTGLGYGEEMGLTPKIYVQPSDHVQTHPDLFPTASSTILPVELVKRKTGFPSWVKFDSNLYFSNLKSKSLGKALLYIPVCESTMPISRSLLDAVPTYDGILIVAGHQTKGVGRGGNQWLCPEGCAMFTFNFNIPLMSVLGQSATFVQHILAVAIVDAVRSLVEVEDFQLSIKWPNDIYYGRQFKIGGIIVTSNISGDTMHCVIGSGLNVANSKPTVCINDMLPEASDQVLTVEEVLAEVMNKFEYYVNLFENRGKEAFLKRYYDFWLHTREEVTVQNGDTGLQERVVIRGLDHHGFLEVRSKQSGKVFSVQDNGNTFDMMKGLIRPKQV